MDDEDVILALIAGFKALKVIDKHADEIAYGHKTVWEGCQPCRVRAAAWLRGTSPDDLPPPCKPIGEARAELEAAKRAAKAYDGEGF